MKKFNRKCDSGEYYAPYYENKQYRIGVFSEDSVSPDWTYELDIQDEQFAEQICSMLQEEYREGHRDGQSSNY